MASLKDRLDGLLIDLDNQIEHTRKQSQEKIDRLKAQKDALKAARLLISPELEAAVLSLQKIGVLSGL